MPTAQLLNVSGCITLEKYIRGRSLAEIEKILGFQTGRLSKGMQVIALTRLPQPNEFELQGYNQVASHRFNTASTKGLNTNVLKQTVMRDVWQLSGPNRVVKVIPNIPHNQNLEPDLQYPPGQGVPQWVIKRPSNVQGVIVATINAYPHGLYG